MAKRQKNKRKVVVLDRNPVDAPLGDALGGEREDRGDVLRVLPTGGARDVRLRAVCAGVGRLVAAVGRVVRVERDVEQLLDLTEVPVDRDLLDGAGPLRRACAALEVGRAGRVEARA